MKTYRNVRYVVATNHVCFVTAMTLEEAAVAWNRLRERGTLAPKSFRATPYLALVDDPDAPTIWAEVETYYRLRDAYRPAKAPPVEVNLFEEREAAEAAAREINEWSEARVVVVAFTSVLDEGVVWR
jgi:hypothetical protein